MNDLEMAKAIAELEGSGLIMSACGNAVFVPSAHGLWPYNPITDLALNCMLRDKYEVGVSYQELSIYTCTDTGYIKDEVYAESKEDIPLAVIECILKSKGLYK